VVSETDLTGAAPEAPSHRNLWSSPDFLKLWTGQTISELGSRITREGIPLTAVLVLHAGTEAMGMLAALGAASALVFGLVAGVWVDRVRRRPLLIATDLGRAAVLASIPIAALAGVLTIGQLYAVAALAGVLTVFFDVAYQSYFPSLVERDQILEGNSKLALSSSTAEIAGPGVTGVLVQLITAPIAILFDALSFLVSALTLFLIRKPEPPPVPHEAQPILETALGGMRFVLGHPVLRALALRSTTAFFFFGFLGSLYVLFAIDGLHFSPAVFGVLIALGGVGALIGALLAPRIVRHLSLGATLIATAIVHGLAALLIPLAGLVPYPWAIALIAIQQLCGDTAFSIYFIHELSLRQTLAPEAVMGRVNAGMNLMSRGAMPLGALAGGFLAARIGVGATLAVAGCGVLLATGWLLTPALRRVATS
jgi:predicted MFS family arabinose efflux permease